MTEANDPKQKIRRLFEQTSKAAQDMPSIEQSGSGNIIAFGDVNIVQGKPQSPRVSVPANPGGEHISEKQKARLKRLVDEVVATEARLKKSPKSYGSVWGALNRRCGVSSYHLIASCDFELAQSYLHVWLGRLNSMRSAPVKNGTAWREKRYAYIKVNSKDPEDAEAVASYMKRKFNADGLGALANDELEQVYRYIASRRSRRR